VHEDHYAGLTGHHLSEEREGFVVRVQVAETGSGEMPAASRQTRDEPDPHWIEHAR
jgi:hypothetical protein